MAKHNLIINGRIYEGEIHYSYKDGVSRYRIEFDLAPIFPNLPPEKELIFNAEKLTYEPKYPDSNQNESSKPE